MRQYVGKIICALQKSFVFNTDTRRECNGIFFTGSVYSTTIRVYFQIMSKKIYILGYDIGGTKLAVSLGCSDGTVLASERLANKDTLPDEILPQLVEISQRMVAENNLTMDQIRAFGISSPGKADYPNGIMISPTNNPLWKNVHIRSYMEKNLGIKGYFENDAKCGMLAEWFFGAGRNCSNAIYLTMSTGIGAGIIVNGHLLQGAIGCGGEVGHMVIEPNGRQCNCGLVGCYEAYCGGRAIAQYLQQELKDQPDSGIVKAAGGKLENIDLVALEKAVRAGDDYACKVWDDMCRRNAQAYGMLIMAFNPEKLILGTIAWAAGDLFMQPVMKYIKDYAWEMSLNSCQIVTSALRRDIGSYAGMAAALNGLYEAGEYQIQS